MALGVKRCALRVERLTSRCRIFMIDKAVSFDNTENAFAYKSDAELKKARFLFKSMGNAFLVKWGTRITE